MERNRKNQDNINKADANKNKQSIDFLEIIPRDDEECFSAIAILTNNPAKKREEYQVSNITLPPI